MKREDIIGMMNEVKERVQKANSNVVMFNKLLLGSTKYNNAYFVQCLYSWAHFIQFCSMLHYFGMLS